MVDNTSPRNNKIAKNTILLYVRMVFVLLVGLYTSRVVLNVLGVSDYGVYNVVAGFVSLFSFLNATLASSLQRFYNFEEGKNGYDGVTRVFSVGLKIHLVLAFLILILLETIGIWYINSIMVLPEGRLPAANVLFQFSIASLFLLIIEIPFSSAVFAFERMDFFAIVSIIDVVLRLIIVILLPHFLYDKLIIYGFLQLCVSIIDFALYFVYTKKNFTFLKLEKYTDKVLLKNLLSFSGWNLLGTFIFMLKGQGLNVLLNAFFGTIVNAARGVAFQVNSAISGFSANIAMSFRPQMVSSYAEGNNSRAYSLFKAQSKICFCLILMLITPVVFEIDLILRLWLGRAIPDNTNLFTILVLVDALICTLNTPVTQIVFATGNIKMFQILTSSVNVFLLPVSWLFLKCGFDAWIVFLITIVVSIINQVIAIYVMNKVFPFDISDYIKTIILPCCLLTLFVPLLPYVICCFIDDSFLRLILLCISSIVATISSLYLFFLSESEKQLAKTFLLKLIRK